MELHEWIVIFYKYVELVRTSIKIGEGKKHCMLRIHQ